MAQQARTRSRAVAETSAPVISYASMVAGIVLEGQAQASLAMTTMLEKIVALIKDKAIVALSEEDWTKHWSKDVLDTLIASGRYKVDANGKSASAAFLASTIKIAVMAISRGYMPEEHERDIKTFVDNSARAYLKKEGFIGKSAKSKGGRKGGANQTDEQKAAKKAEKKLLEACTYVCFDNEREGKMLALIASDEKSYDELVDWLELMIDKRANKGRQGAAGRSRTVN